MRILFQGDSITDAGRDRSKVDHMGRGYALYIKSELGYEQPEQHVFFNRGISGNRIVDVYARIKSDIINLQPDYMSILIGVNDVLHEFDEQNGVDAEKFEKIYCMLIEEIKEALPNIKIVIMEPFCLRAWGTDNTEEYPNKWEEFHTEVRKRAKKARKVAQKYELSFVELQSKFDEAALNTENTYWLRDGIHPTAFGNQLIKREWLKKYTELVEKE